jgi:hypothetical protein
VISAQEVWSFGRRRYAQGVPEAARWPFSAVA